MKRFVYIAENRAEHDFDPGLVLRKFRFRIMKPDRKAVQLYGPAAAAMLPNDTAEVWQAKFLNDERVLYREYRDGGYSELIFEAKFEESRIVDVIQSLKACGASGPIEELESLIPRDSAKVKNENRRKPYLEQMRFRNSAGDIHHIADKNVLKTLKFYEIGGWDIEGHVEAGPIYASIDMSTIVLVVSGLPEGRVLYRTPIDSKGEFVDVFEVRRIADVIETLEISGATGPIEELKALLPSKPSNRNPSYSSYDPNHAVSADGKPSDQSDLEKGEPENAEIPTGPSRPNGPHYCLAVAYVKWLESPDGYDAVCAKRKISAVMLCPDDIVEAFRRYVKRNRPGLLTIGKPDDAIRNVLKANPKLASRVRSVFQKVMDERAIK